MFRFKPFWSIIKRVICDDPCTRLAYAVCVRVHQILIFYSCAITFCLYLPLSLAPRKTLNHPYVSPMSPLQYYT